MHVIWLTSSKLGDQYFLTKTKNVRTLKSLQVDSNVQSITVSAMTRNKKFSDVNK